MKRFAAVTATVWFLVGCGTTASAPSAISGTGGASAATSASGGAAGQGGQAGQGGEGGASGPHVQITEGRLLIDGTPTFLYGGEVQYFRVRDKEFDAAKTEAIWSQTFDTMKAAGMNLVTTYAAWDYHHLGPDKWDFTGARDVKKFVDMACERGFYVIYKPGPLITAEWPRGFGTFGAVPEWWKEAHPETLMRKANGDFYSYAPGGDERQRQPTYLHPVFLDAVRVWYEKSLDQVKHHLGGCLIGLQVDNETNFYWSNRYGDVDYSATALSHYRKWLEAKYTTIDKLNDLYGTSHAGFAEVAPPESPPGNELGQEQRKKNVWYADWYWAGQAYVGEYLDVLRKMFTDFGYDEPDVMFHTNDSPFTLLFEDFQIREVNLHDGPTKNKVGLGTLDLYSKQFPSNDSLHEQAFQLDYYTRLYDHYGDAYTGKQDYIYGAELQGGFYPFPVVGHPNVRPEATDQMIARTIGRGLKGGAFYVYRDGYNLDNSEYSYQSAVALDGTTTDRYDVIKRWGLMAAREGTDLLDAKEVRDRVAIVQNGLYAAPQAGMLDNMQRLYTQEYPALFGWLANAGLNPDVVDSRLVDSAALKAYDVVFYLNPDFVDDPTAKMLTDYVNGGGVLVNLLWPGRVNDRFVTSPETKVLSTEIFPAVSDGHWQWKNLSRAGRFNLEIGEPETTPLSFWYESFWLQPEGKTVTPFAWEREAITGNNKALVGYVMDDASGKRAFLGTNVFSRFNQSEYYGWKEDDVKEAGRLARWLAALGGVTPAIRAEGVRELVWARRTTDKLYLFVVNDNDEQRSVSLRFDDPAMLGLERGQNYVVRDELDDVMLQTTDTTQLTTTGLTVTVPKWSSALVTLTKP